jgi:uncharacterized protein (DUF697 family)
MVDKPQQQPANSLPSTQEHKPSLVESVSNTAGAVVGGIIDIGKAVGEVAAKGSHKLIEKATQEAGHVINRFSNNWLVRRLSGFLNLNWLVGAVDTVNLDKAAAEVKKLQQEHPEESPSQIAHRIMVDKATKAGGIGLASSVLPGFAAALLAVDLAATTQIQSEMVYQIAAAYGLDLKDSSRQGEVLAIFGLGLGGGRLLRAAGLGLLRNIPFAGAVIGASSNAAMIYSLGYAACRFYEAKLDDSKTLTSEKTLAELETASQNYLQTAIAQQAVMDQILVHMILASHPEKTWEEIVPELQTLNLSSNSLAAIADNIKSPQPLNTLLAQLNRDFAMPLLARCYKIAQQDNEISSHEAGVIEAIAKKFDIDLNEIKSIVNSQ